MIWLKYCREMNEDWKPILKDCYVLPWGNIMLEAKGFEKLKPFNEFTNPDGHVIQEHTFLPILHHQEKSSEPIQLFRSQFKS